MSGFLYQIENRQKNMQQEHKDNGKRKPSKPDPKGRKTIGVKVDPTTYEDLVRLKERRRLSGLREALLVAAREGLQRLL